MSLTCFWLANHLVFSCCRGQQTKLLHFVLCKYIIKSAISIYLGKVSLFLWRLREMRLLIISAIPLIFKVHSLAVKIGGKIKVTILFTAHHLISTDFRHLLLEPLSHSLVCWLPRVESAYQICLNASQLHDDTLEPFARLDWVCLNNELVVGSTQLPYSSFDVSKVKPSELM